MKKCPSCGRIYNRDDEYYCLACNHRLETYSEEDIVKDQIEWLQNEENSKNNITLKCPVCGSPKVNKISTANRLTSVFAFGLASSKIGKQYQCKNCKHKW